MDKIVLLTAENILTTGMLEPISLKVEPQQVWMLTGPSGSGKTRFLKALADLIPHSGQAWLNGQDQQEVCPEHWRQKVMYFSADTAWWSDTVIEHFETEPEESLLQSIGLSSAILKRHPDNCSSGEKQRLALLRGLALKPGVLLLDEITANLDENRTLQVEQLVKDYMSAENSKQQRAVIWVSHDQIQCQRLTDKDQILYINLPEGVLN